MTDVAAIELVRAYLAAFLSAERADELSRQVTARLGEDPDRTALLTAAHQRLIAEVRVADEAAVDVMVRDLGVSEEDAARVLDLPRDRVAAVVLEAESIVQELDAAPARATGVEADRPGREPDGAEPAAVRHVFDTEAPPDPTPEPTSGSDTALDQDAGRGWGHRVLALLVGAVVLVAVVLAVITSGGSGGEPRVDATGVASEVTITEVRTTDRMLDGQPGPAKDVFGPDEHVIFWFAFEPVDGRAMIELVLLRDGDQLIAPTFPLPQTRSDSHVSLPRVVTEDAGRYHVELRRDGRVLAEARFAVQGQ